MPRKQVITREAILDAAFNIVREKGYSELSVRTVAAALGVSTMPIYSQFENMDALEQALFEKITATHIAFQKQSYTNDALLNLSVGTVMFAQDEPQLFRFLHFDHPRKLNIDQKNYLFSGGVVEEINQNLGVNNETDSPFKNLPGIDRQTVGKLAQFGWAFTTGLATMVNTGMLPRLTVDEIVQQIHEAGTAFYLYFSQKKV